MTRAGYSVRTIADLRAVSPSRRSQDAVRFVGEKEDWYYFAPNAIEPDDNDLVIAPSVGTGRWKRRPNSSNGNGNSNGSGNDTLITSGRPMVLPTRAGQFAIDVSPFDRVIIWASVGTNSIDDWVSSASGSSGGGGELELTQLQGRVETLEFASNDLNLQLETKTSINEVKDGLRSLLGDLQAQYFADGVYDTVANTSTFYIPGYDTTFLFKSARLIGGRVEVRPVSIEYIPVNEVPPALQNGSNDHLKLVCEGQINSLIVLIERFVDWGVIDQLINQAFNNGGSW